MIKINGVIYEGKNIEIINGKVKIDGVVQDTPQLTGVIRVEVTGNLTELKTDAAVSVNGDILGNVDARGSVQCNNIGKGVDCGGSVQCGSVGGSIDCGGSVTCGTVAGSIEAGGSVRHQ